MIESLHLCPNHTKTLVPYLPTTTVEVESHKHTSLPKITLTYAASLDSNISLSPGTKTLLSGPESKAMTHYLRAHHDAILVGATTAIVDNPSLNSRWVEACGNLRRQPRPVILDPSGRWLTGLQGNENLLCLAREGRGHAPWVFVDNSVIVSPKALELLESYGGECLFVSGYQGKSNGMDWRAVLSKMQERNVKTLMVEGGASVIHDLLREKNRYLLSTIIVTIAPTYLGMGGVVVSPEREMNTEVFRLKNVKWLPMGEDCVVAGFT